MRLEALKFHWDPTGTAVDALRIRKNFTTAVPSAEWTPDRTAAAESLAAYAIASVSGAVIQILAKFTIDTPGSTTATVSAAGGGILGDIPAFTVRFVDGVSVPEFVTVSLPNHRLGPGSGVGIEDVTWNWSYQSGSGWQPLATTAHRVYSLLAVPTGPWQQSGDVSQDPWTDVLDYSCVWAAGSTDANAAAGAITTKIYGSLSLTYDTATGASTYTQWVQAAQTDVFLCTQFLKFLSEGTGKGNIVNCTDCATIVTTFANSVGCDLFAAWMSDPNAFATYPPSAKGFSCNQIIAIGSSAMAYPFPSAKGGHFRYHEVAWTGAGGDTDPLYDACLQIDDSSDPWTADGTSDPQLPLLIPFTTEGDDPALPIATPFTSWSYRERLCANDEKGIGTCTPLGPLVNTGSGRRPVQ